MITEKLLLRNKKVADYALELCKKLGVSIEYTGKRIYSFLLLYNHSFLDIDFNDMKQVETAFKTLKYERTCIFTDFKRDDHTQKYNDIIWLSILHFDKNGNEVDINTKCDEIKDIFGEESYVYKSIEKIADYYYPVLDEEKSILIKFSDIVEDKLKEYDIIFNCKMNDEIFNDFIIYITNVYCYLNPSKIVEYIKQFLYVKHIDCKEFKIIQNNQLSIDSIKSSIDNKNLDLKIDRDYSFCFATISEKIDKEYKWTGLIDIKKEDDKKTLLSYYHLNENLEYSYFMKINDYEDSHHSNKAPKTGMYDHIFKLIVPYFVHEDKESAIRKLK